MIRRLPLCAVDRRTVMLFGVTACAPRVLRDERGAASDAANDGSPGRTSDVDPLFDASTVPGSGGDFCVIGAGGLGPPSRYAPGTWTLDRVHTVIIGRDDAGLFAMTAYCSHAGCLVNDPATDGTTLCACHMSRFDGAGNVLAGPATRPLVHLALTLCGGNLVVDHATVVPPTVRLVPPAPGVEPDAGDARDVEAFDVAPGPNQCGAERFVDRSGVADDARMIMVPSPRPAYDFPCVTIRAGQSITFMFDLATYPLAPGVAPSRASVDAPGSEPNPIVATTSGTMYRVTFADPGIYPFYCPTYGSEGMSGVIEVH